MEEPNTILGYVYLATNIVTGKKYVGYTTKTVKARWAEHKSYAKRGSSTLLHRALRKYGFEAFRLECIETVQGSHADLEAAEIRHIVIQACVVPKGYNLTHGGDGVDFKAPGVRERHVAAQRKKVADPVWRERNAEQLRQQHADPNWQAANAMGIRKAQQVHREKAIARYAHLPPEEQARRARRRERDRLAKAAKYALVKQASP